MRCRQIDVEVTAREVAEVIPAAVVPTPDGCLYIDYRQLGLCLQVQQMRQEWKAG